MSKGVIHRDPEGAAARSYDLIIVGGGVYGIMVALEAARRRIRPLLLERADFGGATSHNSLRILHGGLRYLQTLKIGRSIESIRERAWWLRHFPELVQPLPCLMPLYGDGLRRPLSMRLALRLNDFLCRWQAPDGELPRGRIIDTAAVRRLCPEIDPQGLMAGAIWYDAVAANAPRLLIEALRWACAEGAVALNYVQASGPLEASGRVAGVEGCDLETGAKHAFQAPVVINAAGPWSRAFAASAGADEPRLFQPALAWNVVFRRAPPSDHALAVRARRPGAQTYFLVPQQDALVAGTGYAPWLDGLDRLRLPGSMLEAFIGELNAAMPGLGLRAKNVVRTYLGLLPAAHAGTAQLSDQALVVDHASTGGPAGLFSVSGVKLTTARAVAERVLTRAFPSARPIAEGSFARPRPTARPSEGSGLLRSRSGPERWQQALHTAVREEAALHLDDLLLRRLGVGDDPERTLATAAWACRELGWDRERTRAELERLETALHLTKPAETSSVRANAWDESGPQARPAGAVGGR